MAIVVKQRVEMRNELLEAPILTEGPNKGKEGSKALAENSPVVMDGPNRGLVLNKSFISLAPGNAHGLPGGTYPYDKVTKDILANEPIHPHRSNETIIKHGEGSSTPKVYVENPLGLMEKMNALEAQVAALTEKKKMGRPKKTVVTPASA